MSGQIEHRPDAADGFLPLRRRGFALGFVRRCGAPAMQGASEVARRWSSDMAVQLPGLIDLQRWQREIGQARTLMEQTLTAGELAPWLERSPWRERLAAGFALVASSFEEHDEQGIEKVYFDAGAPGGDCIAEDLWCKASWLSFIEDDASLRFRFSFGMECLEDVAADPLRQQQAALLCDAIFPESAAITDSAVITDLLTPLLGGAPAFVERIVYFNAPNGGAQMHHDVERGHDGVVFAQLSGSTCWLALNKQLLIDELIAFVNDPAHDAEIGRLLPDSEACQQLRALIADRAALAEYMEAFDHELVEAVMDRSALFTGHLIGRGYGYMLEAGDVLLLPQRDLERCVWHSVITLGEAPGEALSFAVRRAA